jgi:hypothetical protein
MTTTGYQKELVRRDDFLKAFHEGVPVYIDGKRVWRLLLEGEWDCRYWTDGSTGKEPWFAFSLEPPPPSLEAHVAELERRLEALADRLEYLADRLGAQEERAG